MTEPTRDFPDLNPQQRAAVFADDGPTLVLAGPGSGKTRVLTYRAAHLIGNRAIEPWHVMAVTFTNKAAREMRHRVEQLLGEGAAKAMALGTFHATCARWLRVEAGALGRSADFVIFDADDQLAAVRQALSDLNLNDKTYRPSAVRGAISSAKNELLRPEDYRPPTYFHEVAGRVYRRYQAILRASNALDFDDLLLETALLLRDVPEVRHRYQRRYAHLLVDEFQDTNTAQYALLKSLAAVDDPSAPHNLFAVGDEDQSIYRWRGADYRNIDRFRRDLPEARTILLEQNYRSTQVILDAARSVIDVNRHRTPKKLWTESGRGAQIGLFEAYDEQEEAAYVVRRIEAYVREGKQYGDFAVMYRTNVQSRALEDAFVRRGVRYQLVGATRFYERREVKDVLAYLRLVHNPNDDMSLGRIINVPARGIGPRSLTALGAWAEAAACSRWDALGLIASDDGDIPGAPSLDTRTKSALCRFQGLMTELVGARDLLATTDLLDAVLERTGYVAYVRDGTEEGEGRWENLLELRGVAAEFEQAPPRDGLAAMLESVALVSDVDSLGDERDRVTLLTLHSAKGLEFDTVFLTGLEERILPHSRSIDDPEALAEERRLFYVGLTRARARAHLVHTHRRMVFGAHETREPSRFLDDVPPELLGDAGQVARPAGDRRGGIRAATRARRIRWDAAPVAADTTPASGDAGFRPGDRVSHATFGDGVVVSSTTRDGDEEVTVAFAGAGVKRLMQRFAKLTRR